MRIPIKRAISILTLIICVGCASGNLVAASAASAQRHVVVVVWDGMRPDCVTEEDAPTLWKLAKEGVVFRNHHSVYPSATNVNGTALVTGGYPGRSGIMANHVYQPDIDNKKSIDVENPEVVKKGDALSGGKYVAFPTIAELVRAAGRQTVTAAAKTVGLLQDRHFDSKRDKDSAVLVSGQMQSSDALASIVKLAGLFPTTYAQKDAWTTKALTDVFWKDRVPAFSLLWLSEPDGTQHETAPGSPEARAAIKSADANLAAVLSALDRFGARATTNIFVVSDHGFSTIERSIDLRKILSEANFDAATEFSSQPRPGQIMLSGNAGTVFFYVVQHDAAVTRRLVEFLQQSDFAGVILTRDKVPGTFGLEQAKIDNEHAPDVVMAFRWNDRKNQFGVPGMIDADWERAAGKGTHATLSRFDMHNTLIAAGPSLRRGTTDDYPTGNVDLAPTILKILGIMPPKKMDGRILGEVLADNDLAGPRPEPEFLEAKRDFSSGTWRQKLKIFRIGSTIYLDEGNGSFTLNMRN
jgi:predicted AlkP superfamily pyrophosphatase or phosphodiesterase